MPGRENALPVPLAPGPGWRRSPDGWRLPASRQEGVADMELGRLGVWTSTDRLDAAGLKSLLKVVEGLGYFAFWYPESRGYESMALGGFLLANSTKLMIGSSIANIYARDAFTAKRGL